MYIEESDMPQTGSRSAIHITLGNTFQEMGQGFCFHTFRQTRGYDLEIVEYTDYVQPNNALESGDLDANYFQHKPYLDTFNEENGTHLVSAGAIHYEPFGIYAGKSDSLDELADGAEVLVPNDVTNEARALLLLQDQGASDTERGCRSDRNYQ